MRIAHRIAAAALAALAWTAGAGHALAAVAQIVVSPPATGPGGAVDLKAVSTETVTYSTTVGTSAAIPASGLPFVVVTVTAEVDAWVTVGAPPPAPGSAGVSRVLALAGRETRLLALPGEQVALVASGTAAGQSSGGGGGSSGGLTNTELRASPVPVQGSRANDGSALTVGSSHVSVGGSDGTNLRPIAVDTGGRPRVGALPTAASVSVVTVATAGSGSGWTAFSSLGAQLLDIVNTTGVPIEYRRGGAGSSIVIPSGSARMVAGITNVNQIEVRRVDQAVTQVSVNAEAITP